MLCPAPAFGSVGGPCDTDGDCGINHFCADEGEGFPADGYCTFECAVNTDCPSGSSCVDITTTSGGGGGPDKLCLPDCCAGDTCADGMICSDVIAGFIPLDANACVPGDSAAHDHDACTDFGQCNKDSACLAGPENPGGNCAQVGCVVGDNTTCADANSICIGPNIGGQGACYKSCDTSADCRASEGYQCFDIGALSVCGHSGFGDPCTAAADCGVSPWTCDTGQTGGYCTIPCDPMGNDCGDNGVCHDADGNPATQDAYCADVCRGAGQGSCRTGYTCFGGSAMTDGYCLPALP